MEQPDRTEPQTAFPYRIKGTAFPSREGGQVIHLETVGGMSLRDWFAGVVMQGFLANDMTRHTADVFASLAYDYADAMLKARND